MKILRQYWPMYLGLFIGTLVGDTIGILLFRLM